MNVEMCHFLAGIAANVREQGDPTARGCVPLRRRHPEFVRRDADARKRGNDAGGSDTLNVS